MFSDFDRVAISRLNHLIVRSLLFIYRLTDTEACGAAFIQLLFHRLMKWTSGSVVQ